MAAWADSRPILHLDCICLQIVSHSTGGRKVAAYDMKRQGEDYYNQGVEDLCSESLAPKTGLVQNMLMTFSEVKFVPQVLVVSNQKRWLKWLCDCFKGRSLAASSLLLLLPIKS